MNRFTRMLLMSGLGLVTGVAIGAGPAAAAPNTSNTSNAGQSASRPEANTSPQWRGDRIVGFFRNYRICVRAGEWGEDEGWWDDYDCFRTGGFHNRFALVVDENDWGHGWHGHWPGSWVGQWWPGH